MKNDQIYTNLVFMRYFLKTTIKKTEDQDDSSWWKWTTGRKDF